MLHRPGLIKIRLIFNYNPWYVETPEKICDIMIRALPRDASNPNACFFFDNFMPAKLK